MCWTVDCEPIVMEDFPYQGHFSWLSEQSCAETEWKLGHKVPNFLL